MVKSARRRGGLAAGARVLPFARGFTLIELLVVLSIIALLLSLAVPKYIHSVDVAKEAVLNENLHLVRETIDKFYGDKGRYPESLDELVNEKYLRALPFDPITGSTPPGSRSSHASATTAGVVVNRAATCSSSAANNAPRSVSRMRGLASSPRASGLHAIGVSPSVRH